MMLKIFFDISTGFRFSKISVECSVHLCSCPCINQGVGIYFKYFISRHQKFKSCFKIHYVPMCSASPALCSMQLQKHIYSLALQAAAIQKKRESRHHYKTCSPFIRVQQIRKIVFQKKIRSLNTPVTHHQLASFSNVYECLLYQIDFISILFFLDCIK